MRARRAAILPFPLLLLACAAVAAGEERLTPQAPKPSKETFTRPDKGLSDLKGEKAGRREAMEEKTENIDRRIDLREEARREAAANAARKPSTLFLTTSISLSALSFSGWAQKGPKPGPGDRVDCTGDLGLPRWLACPELNLDLAVRRRSGAFASIAFLGGKGDSLAEPGGLAYHCVEFPAWTGVESIWESIRAHLGLYYALSTSKTAGLKVCLGVKYVRSLLVADGVGWGAPRAAETSDVFMLTLGFDARYMLSDSVYLALNLTLSWLSFGGEKYFQENMGVEARAAIVVPLWSGTDLSAGYGIEHIRASREDRGMVEESSDMLHGLMLSLELRIF